MTPVMAKSEAAALDGDRVVVTFDGKFLDYRW